MALFEFLQFSSELDPFLLHILYRLCKPKPLQVSGYTLQYQEIRTFVMLVTDVETEIC